MQAYLEKLDILPKPVILGFSVFLLFAIGILDWNVRGELGFSVFYIVPSALVTWYVGRKGGIVLCLAAAGIWLAAELHDFDRESWGVALWNTTARFLTFAAFTYTIDAFKTSYSIAQKLSQNDELTGVANWRGFWETLLVEVERARRYRYPIALAYLDLDNFKTVNDRFGHARGNDLLKATACLIAKGLRSSDRVGRIGGDEFTILMPHTNRKHAEQIVHRLHRALVAMAETEALPVGFSFGVVSYEVLNASADDMLASADTLMYRAKQQGKNRAVFDDC